MKSKTNFKQMYLVDATAYNNRIDAPIILGRSNNPPPTINVLAPVTSGVDSGYPIHTELKSVGTQSNVLNTKSTGVVTEPPPNKADQASQTRKLQYRSPQNNNRLSQDDNRSSRDNNRLSQPQDSQNFSENSNLQIEHDSQISKKEIPLNTHLQYIVPDPEFQKAISFSTYQHSATLPQPQPQHMNTIEYSTPPALPQPQIMNTIQHSSPKALPQPQHMDAIEYSSPLALPHPQIMNTIHHSSPLALPQAQLMDTIQHSVPLALPQPKPMNTIQHFTPSTLSQQQPSINPQINHLPPSQTHPQLMDTSTNTETPQLMDYSVNQQNSASALPAPEEDDCKECAVTKYRKYDVSLPYSRGLPENSVFTCTLCETNFSTKKSLQRHMKNMHDAYNQVEKGIKRKSKQGKISKKLRTSHEIVPYFMYGNPT